MGSSSSSSVTNNISNFTLNRSDLEAFNSQVNEFVTNTVTKNTSMCSSGATLLNENNVGDINVVGKNQRLNIGLNASQKSNVSLDCIQKAVQQTNVGNAIAQGIFQNLQQDVNNDQLTKMVAAADATMSQGFGGLNPFSSANSDINMNLSNTQINDTTRKLTNMISNKVASNTNNSNFQQCGSKSFLSQANKLGNINMIGEENIANITLNSDQYSDVISKCEQLTQQTSATTNDVATTLGLKIVDETTNKTTSDTKSDAKSVNKIGGIGEIFSGLFSGLFGGLLAGPIGSALSICCLIICCIVSSLLIFKGGSGGSSNSSTEESSDSSPPPPPDSSAQDSSPPAETPSE